MALDAARLALARSPGGTVAVADFVRTLEMELEGRWAGQPSEQMGFAKR